MLMRKGCFGDELDPHEPPPDRRERRPRQDLGRLVGLVSSTQTEAKVQDRTECSEKITADQLRQQQGTIMRQTTDGL